MQRLHTCRQLVSKFWLAPMVVALLGGATHAQNQFLSPSKNLKVSGVPPIPISLSTEVQPYTSVYGLPIGTWHPTKREVWLKGLSSVTWISQIARPLATPQPSSIYIQSGGIYDVYFQPQGKYLAYTRDTHGNEQFQLYLYDIEARQSALLSDQKSRNTEPVWSNTGNKIVYSCNPFGSEGVDLRLLNPFDKETDGLLVKSSGTYLKAYDWSPDDKTIVYCDFTSNTTSTLWLINVDSGKRVLLSPKSAERELYDSPQFSKDGKGVYVITDHKCDFRRIAYIDLATLKISYLKSPTEWDVEEFQIAPNGRLIAFTTNENGISIPHVFDLVEHKERKLEDLPVGIIWDIKWRKDSSEFAFNLKSPSTPNDVYSIDASTGKAELWAKSVDSEAKTKRFLRPDLFNWKSFDNRDIYGFLYRPPANFKGKRPVIIDLHGGPEEQYRPGFIYADNYIINELGVAKIYPNVRGSSGYGKQFLNLDNGVLRPNAVKDIGALLDWIKSQDYLDSGRVMVEGASYGGYLALSTAFTYPDRIQATISDSGMTDLVSFVQHTEGWRRELQRSEFGDERNLKDRENLAKLSPLNNSAKIKKPLLIVQGLNDPRVPVADTDQLVAATKKRVPVWYVLAKDEGHGFAQKDNRDYQLYATILFVKEFLLK